MSRPESPQSRCRADGGPRERRQLWGPPRGHGNRCIGGAQRMLTVLVVGACARRVGGGSMPHMHMRANEFYTVLSGALPPCRRAGSALRVSGRSSDRPRCRTIRAASMAQLRMHVMPLHHTVCGTYPGLAVHHAGPACCALRSGESTVTARRGCLIAP